MAKFKYSMKLEIKIPKVDAKAETKKMQAAMSKATIRGAQKGATYIEKGLRAALDQSLDSQWTWISGT